MYFKQFYLGCLAHASYLIASQGEAAVIDPQRDVAQYINEASAQNLQIKYVIETHLHADFVSGHRELATATGAEIVFGARADAAFPHRAITNNEELSIGNVKLRILETPGHTPESISILVIDSEISHDPIKVLTGDTLFIGDVGRPDLVGSKGYSTEEMAGMLFDSLHEKLLTLDDSVEVYPAHGAGSLCGRNISKETSSTIGAQKQFNYALKIDNRDEFINMMTRELPEVPAYFPRDAEINRAGAISLKELSTPEPLAATTVNNMLQKGAMVLDVRSGADYCNGHIPGSINIGLNGQFASWAGSILTLGTPLILIAEDKAQVDEALLRLARVGIESVKGYLDGGIYAWHQAQLPINKIDQWTVDELHNQLAAKKNLFILDVRRPGEYKGGHVPGARNIQLTELEKRLGELNNELHSKREIAVICAGGYRSSIAVGIMANKGFATLYNIAGGTGAWTNSGYEVEKPATA